MGLTLKVMSPLMFTKFLTRIANVMFVYKRYPEKADFDSVAEQIVNSLSFHDITPGTYCKCICLYLLSYYCTVIHFFISGT